MSSITERRLRAAMRVVAVAGLIALGWMVANAAILLLSEKADAVLVVFAREAGTFALPKSVAILDWDGHSARLVGSAGGYVADLYRAGALVVLPARGGGCRALR